MIQSVILLVKSCLKWSAEQFCVSREKILDFMVRDLKKFGKHWSRMPQWFGLIKWYAQKRIKVPSKTYYLEPSKDEEQKSGLTSMNFRNKDMLSYIKALTHAKIYKKKWITQLLSMMLLLEECGIQKMRSRDKQTMTKVWQEKRKNIFLAF